jgi:uncharacterized protein YbjQ (UPF0145 family)
MEYQSCPNCNKKLNGLMTTKFITKQSTTDFINRFNTAPSDAYCSGCSGPLVDKYKADLALLVKDSIGVIPVITLNNPMNWDYEVLGMVTGQSVTGTGMMSELASSWSDLIGGQSNSLGAKISNGEVLCKNQLKYKAAMMGANAVVATDIDYSEVGSVKGMLMVCMAGTAVKVTNLSEITSINEEKLLKLESAINLLSDLKKLNS